MKTLIENSTKESKFVWPDAEIVVMEEDVIKTPTFHIGDLNSTNSTLVENVTPPDDWFACKYLYDAGAWTLNPNWVDPTQV